MSEGRRVGCFAVVALSMVGGLGVVCLGLFGLTRAPGWLMDMVVEEEPQAGVYPVSEEARDQLVGRKVHELNTTRTTRVSGPELTRILLDTWPGQTRGGVVLEDGWLQADGSFRVDTRDLDGWVNVRVRGAFTIREGQFERLAITQLDVAGWDWGDADADPIAQAAQANLQIARRRATSELPERLDQVTYASVEDDTLVVEVTEAASGTLRPPTGYAPPAPSEPEE